MSDQQLDVVKDGFGSVDEAKRFLSIGRSTVYQLIESGQLPYAKIGRARRIPYHAIRQLDSELFPRVHHLPKPFAVLGLDGSTPFTNVSTNS